MRIITNMAMADAANQRYAMSSKVIDESLKNGGSSSLSSSHASLRPELPLSRDGGGIQHPGNNNVVIRIICTEYHH
ncbi:hypothetical protein [Serratia proteamaculans]|uniref:hypothetical protein n=1 Tax=Serratia proteamaculans TaxID=28151 RepID=UPI0021BD7785|nr:hypothetical protein [Serratia proteamaculans]